MHNVCVCIKKKWLVERVAKNVSIKMITLKVEQLTLSTQGYNKQLHTCEKRITSLSASSYILNLCVLKDLRLFLVKYYFFNRLEETFKLFKLIDLPLSNSSNRRK